MHPPRNVPDPRTTAALLAITVAALGCGELAEQPLEETPDATTLADGEDEGEVEGEGEGEWNRFLPPAWTAPVCSPPVIELEEMTSREVRRARVECVASVDGAVGARFLDTSRPPGSFFRRWQVERLTSYRVMGMSPFGEVLEVEQSVTYGALSVRAGQRFTIDTAFAPWTYDNGVTSTGLVLESIGWRTVQIPARAVITLLGGTGGVAANPQPRSFYVAPGTGAVVRVALVNLGPARTVRLQLRNGPAGLGLPEQTVEMAAGGATEVKLQFFSDNDTPSAANVPIEVAMIYSGRVMPIALTVSVGCGDEGVPMCRDGTCKPRLHPDLRPDGDVVCTSACGGPHESACMTKFETDLYGVQSRWRCYEYTALQRSGECWCVPGAAKETDVAEGLCAPGSSVDPADPPDATRDWPDCRSSECDEVVLVTEGN